MAQCGSLCCIRIDVGKSRQEITHLWRIATACDAIVAEILRYGLTHSNRTRLEWYLQVSHSMTLLKMVLHVPSWILQISLKFLLIHTLYILWSVFHACASRLLMWCIYNKANGKKSPIWLHHNNQTNICQSVFWNIIHTYRTSGYQQYLHFYPLEHLVWLNQVLPILSFRNMTLADHTGKDLKFWLQIPNLLEIWAQMIYRPSHMGSL